MKQKWSIDNFWIEREMPAINTAAVTEVQEKFNEILAAGLNVLVAEGWTQQDLVLVNWPDTRVSIRVGADGLDLFGVSTEWPDMRHRQTDDVKIVFKGVWLPDWKS